jgi:hypothetical protein
LLNSERQQLTGEAIGKKLADGNCNKNNIVGKKGGKKGKITTVQFISRVVHEHCLVTVHSGYC